LTALVRFACVPSNASIDAKRAGVFSGSAKSTTISVSGLTTVKVAALESPFAIQGVSVILWARRINHSIVLVSSLPV
jgi:hypothetical protein